MALTIVARDRGDIRVPAEVRVQQEAVVVTLAMPLARSGDLRVRVRRGCWVTVQGHAGAETLAVRLPVPAAACSWSLRNGVLDIVAARA